MQPLPAAVLLELWERGSSQPAPLAAVSLLSAATGEEPSAIARLPVGERDVRLLRVYRALRGRRVEGVSSCPACNETVEAAFDVDALVDAVHERTDTITCSAKPFRATLRLPSTEDLLAVSSMESRADMREALLRRCVIDAWRGKKKISAAALPDAFLDKAEAAMERADPAGDVRFVLTCPACAHEWEVALDAASFVWNEVSALAQRVAADVHLLASAYGWREADILAMSTARRQLYIRQAYG